MRNLPEYHTLTNRWSNKRGMRHCNIGVLTSPFMRAALVIEVDPSAATASEIRPARFYTNYKDGQFSHLVRAPAKPDLGCADPSSRGTERSTPDRPW